MSDSPGNTNKSPISSTIAAVVAAIGASLCCVAPLVLITLGISGAWISQLTALEPYSPIFSAITLLFLFLAFRKLYLIPRQCSPGDSCALPGTLRNQRIIFWLVTVAVIAIITFPYYGLMFFE